MMFTCQSGLQKQCQLFALAFSLLIAFAQGSNSTTSDQELNPYDDYEQYDKYNKDEAKTSVEVELSLLGMDPEDIQSSSSVQFVFNLVVASLARSDVAPMDVYFLEAYTATFASVLAAPSSLAAKCVPEVHTYQSTRTYWDNSTLTYVTEPYTYEVVTGILSEGIQYQNVTLAKFLIVNVPVRETANITMNLMECPKLHYAILEALSHRRWSDGSQDAKSVLLEYLTFVFSSRGRPTSTTPTSSNNATRLIPNYGDSQINQKTGAGLLIASAVVLGFVGLAAVTFSVRRVLLVQQQQIIEAKQDPDTIMNDAIDDPSELVNDVEVGGGSFQQQKQRNDDDNDMVLGQIDSEAVGRGGSFAKPSVLGRGAFKNSGAAGVVASLTSKSTKTFKPLKDDDDHDSGGYGSGGAADNSNNNNNNRNTKAPISGVIDDSFFQSDSDSDSSQHTDPNADDSAPKQQQQARATISSGNNNSDDSQSDDKRSGDGDDDHTANDTSDGKKGDRSRLLTSQKKS